MNDEEYKKFIIDKVRLEYENQLKISNLLDMCTKLVEIEMKKEEDTYGSKKEENC